jgi:putative tryptophan/tyrosine transport system substrate-binding protein
MSSELSAKRLQLTQKAILGLAKVALFVNPSDPVSSKRYADENRVAADMLKIELISIDVRAPGDLDRAFADAKRASADAVVLIVDAMFFNERRQIGDAPLCRLPQPRRGQARC